ncbi:MAG: DUF354 domain-containing protein [Opitutales bacterium]|nr:DUF354 domain-containing protein [Opitutales bacterium]
MARILIEAHHPAHIHFWKFIIKELQERGHQILLVGRDRDVMRHLLKAFDWIPSVVPTRAGRGKANIFPFSEMLKRQWALYRSMKNFQPDLVLSLMGSYTQMARLLGIPNWVFTDSEFQHFNHRISHPFADRIYTPSCFYKSLGKKQRIYHGYHELTFLHPRYFAPNPEVLSYLGGARAGHYVIFRISAWDTLHDWKHSGLGDQLPEIIETVREIHPVYIIAEGGSLPPDWERYRFKAPPHLFHDALAFARLVVTEGASTASEATCLGVPSFYVNSTEARGYLLDQSQRYGWPVCQENPEGLKEKIKQELTQNRSPDESLNLRNEVISEHIEVGQYILEEIENEFPRQ